MSGNYFLKVFFFGISLYLKVRYRKKCLRAPASLFSKDFDPFLILLRFKFFGMFYAQKRTIHAKTNPGFQTITQDNIKSAGKSPGKIWKNAGQNFWHFSKTLLDRLGTGGLAFGPRALWFTNFPMPSFELIQKVDLLVPLEKAPSKSTEKRSSLAKKSLRAPAR